MLKIKLEFLRIVMISQILASILKFKFLIKIQKMRVKI